MLCPRLSLAQIQRDFREKEICKKKKKTRRIQIEVNSWDKQRHTFLIPTETSAAIICVGSTIITDGKERLKT